MVMTGGTPGHPILQLEIRHPQTPKKAPWNSIGKRSESKCVGIPQKWLRYGKPKNFRAVLRVSGVPRSFPTKPYKNVVFFSLLAIYPIISHWSIQ